MISLVMLDSSHYDTSEIKLAMWIRKYLCSYTDTVLPALVDSGCASNTTLHHHCVYIQNLMYKF